MANNPNVGPEPVEAEPNHVREKNYEAPKTPKPVHDAKQKLPEGTTRDKVREEMTEAVEKVKRRS